jgi:hypothetical protein
VSWRTVLRLVGPHQRRQPRPAGKVDRTARIKWTGAPGGSESPVARLASFDEIGPGVLFGFERGRPVVANGTWTRIPTGHDGRERNVYRLSIEETAGSPWITVEMLLCSTGIGDLRLATYLFEAAAIPDVQIRPVLRTASTHGGHTDLALAELRLTSQPSLTTGSALVEPATLETIDAAAASKLIFFLPVMPLQLFILDAWAHPGAARGS